MQRNLSIDYRERALPLLLILAGAGTMTVALAADLLDLGGPSGIGPRQFSLALSGLAVLLAGVVLILSVGRRHVGEWLLVGVTVIAVVFAADLLVVNGLPEFAAKHIALVAVGLGVLLISSAPAAAGRREAASWLDVFALDRLELGKLLGLTIQLGLLFVVIRQFRLENQAFYHNVMLLAFYGFLIHYCLPLRYRLPFFLLLSLSAIVGVLGLANGAWVVGLGLGLIGICHLPVSYSVRVGLLLAAGAALAAFRAGWLQAAGLDVVWPVLASMFMFRLIVYLYDLKHGKARPTLASTLAYFFLLPNVVFPFFPIVDYSTFRRTYYDEEQHQIYQTGVQWMLRGVLHLLAYRYVNYYLVIAPQDVASAGDLARYLIFNFALYLRISGQFHLIIGLLHLFGFNLPPTHHLYFLAASFTDLWRRINIYWKDFMMKVFYYPAYFKIRAWGASASLAVATAFVFFLTWFFHAYQWFWLRGSFLLTAPDMLFWLILALLVIANALYEARRGRRRTLGRRVVPLADVAAQALRAAGVFAVMAVLWSLWNSESIEGWLSLMSAVQPTLQNLAALALVFLAIAAVFCAAIWISAFGERAGQPAGQRPGFFRSAAVTGGFLLLLFLAGNPAVYARFGGKAQAFISDLASNRLSDQEAALLQRGYYEDLVGVGRFNSQLWEIYTKRPADWPSIADTEAARPSGDNLIVELVPSTTISFQGARFSTNQWGMRDREYDRVPLPGTYRIALTGPSFVMGSGVADDEVFEWLLEDRLNREGTGGRYARYEILNFAVAGYSALQNLMVLEQKGLSFEPNALFFMAHQREEEAVVMYLADRISAGADFPYPELVELAGRVGADAGLPKVEAERRLRPYGAEILAWTYRRVVEISRANGVQPVWIFMPTLENPLREEEVTRLAGLAGEAGFVALNLSDAYADQDPESLVVAYWDKHPNARAHRLIAERLFTALREADDRLRLFH